MNQSIKAMYKKAFGTKEISIDQWFEFIADQNREDVSEVVEKMYQIQRRLKSFLDGFHHTTKIRKYANHIMWSDVEPFEVVRVISDKCVEIRPMQTKQIVFPKEIYVGGFSAHTADNYNQAYEYTSNETASTMRIRKGKKGWKSGNLKFSMSDAPIKFYDYNF
jgi:hypothetical protein